VTRLRDCYDSESRAVHTVTRRSTIFSRSFPKTIRGPFRQKKNEKFVAEKKTRRNSQCFLTIARYIAHVSWLKMPVRANDWCKAHGISCILKRSAELHSDWLARNDEIKYPISCFSVNSQSIFFFFSCRASLCRCDPADLFRMVSGSKYIVSAIFHALFDSSSICVVYLGQCMQSALVPKLICPVRIQIKRQLPDTKLRIFFACSLAQNTAVHRFSSIFHALLKSSRIFICT